MEHEYEFNKELDVFECVRCHSVVLDLPPDPEVTPPCTEGGDK